MDYLENYVRRSNSMDLTTRQENIEQLIHAAAQKETIVEYLEEAALIREDKDEEEETRGINLSTVHAAKGLGVSHGVCRGLRGTAFSALAQHGAGRGFGGRAPA